MYIQVSELDLVLGTPWISFTLLQSNLIYYLAGFSATTDNAMFHRLKEHLAIFNKYKE